MNNLLTDLVVLLTRSVARRGFLRTIQSGLWYPLASASRGHLTALRSSGASKNMPHPFDEECGVDTSGLLPGPAIVTGHPHDFYNVGYYGVAPSVFRGTCSRWKQTLPPSRSVSDYTFVDLGAGKGRGILLASELPFREVIGIELSGDLARIARNNVERWEQAGRARSEIRVVHQEVTAFSWPPTPLLLYLYNPFGHKVIRRLLAQLPLTRATGALPVDILYVNPDCSFVLDRHPAFAHLWREFIPMSDADQAADFYAKECELVSGYRCGQPF